MSSNPGAKKSTEHPHQGPSKLQFCCSPNLLRNPGALLNYETDGARSVSCLNWKVPVLLRLSLSALVSRCGAHFHWNIAENILKKSVTYQTNNCAWQNDHQKKKKSFIFLTACYQKIEPWVLGNILQLVCSILIFGRMFRMYYSLPFQITYFSFTDETAEEMFNIKKQKQYFTARVSWKPAEEVNYLLVRRVQILKISLKHQLQEPRSIPSALTQQYLIHRKNEL